jgi:release factor glutamine methyltransferase
VTTIKAVLLEAADLLQPSTDTALLDAEILLAQTLGKNRAYLRAWPERELTAAQTETFKQLVSQRQQGQPIAYLIGTREFWSRGFLVTPDVLIPRPETELLIELSLNLIPNNQAFKILDLGTGSGIIAITLAAECPNAVITACDISPAALAVAQTNAKAHQLTNLQFIESHWFNHITDTSYDLIVSNPPYLAKNDPHLQEGDLRFEPLKALVAAKDGLADINTIVKTANNHLRTGGYLMVEHGYNQANQVQEIFAAYNYQEVKTHYDLAGQARVTLGRHLPADKKSF